MGDIHKHIIAQMVLDSTVYFGAQLPESAFIDPEERAIYREIGRRYDHGDEVDLALLVESLPDLNAARVSEVVGWTHTAANWRWYSNEIRREWRTGEAKRIGRSLAETGDVHDAYTRLAEISGDVETKTRRVKEMVVEFVPVIEERYKLRGQLPGYSTGMGKLDSMLLGFRDRNLYYIGARPSDGKTALMISLVRTLCAQGVHVGFLSLESSWKELMARLFACEGGINLSNLSTGYFRNSDFASITDVAERVYGWKLSVVDREAMSIQTIVAKSRELVKADGAQVIFLDYLQIIPQNDHTVPFRIHMNQASIAMKQIARELEVPVIVAAQLGRGASGEKAPQLADFKETGQIEQDADVAILIWHESEHESHLCVEKNRDGATGLVPVFFDRPKMRFVEMEGLRNA